MPNIQHCLMGRWMQTISFLTPIFHYLTTKRSIKDSHDFLDYKYEYSNRQKKEIRDEIAPQRHYN